MSKTITIPTQVKLQQYHKEIQERERRERKDVCVLLSLAVAGLVGVYALVLNGVEQNNITETDPIEIEQNTKQSSTSASVRSLR